MTEVEVTEGGVMVIKFTKDDVKINITKGVSLGFRSTEGNSVCTGPIPDQAGLLGDTTNTQAIPDGTFIPPEGTDPHKSLML